MLPEVPALIQNLFDLKVDLAPLLATSPQVDPSNVRQCSRREMQTNPDNGHSLPGGLYAHPPRAYGANAGIIRRFYGWEISGH